MNPIDPNSECGAPGRTRTSDTRLGKEAGERAGGRLNSGRVRPVSLPSGSRRGYAACRAHQSAHDPPRSGPHGPETSGGMASRGQRVPRRVAMDYYLAEVFGFGLTAFVFIYLATRRERCDLSSQCKNYNGRFEPAADGSCESSGLAGSALGPRAHSTFRSRSDVIVTA